MGFSEKIVLNNWFTLGACHRIYQLEESFSSDPSVSFVVSI